MKKRGYARVLFAAVSLLATASCAYYEAPLSLWTIPPGQLALSNYRFERATVQTMVTAAPDCAAVDPAAAAPADFVLPYEGTRVIAAAPGADICWRRQVGAGQWSEWNRAFTSSGRSIDVRL